jgi:hypothetical protein
MSESKWFTLRGEQYQYDSRWWRNLKAGEREVPGYQVYSDYIDHWYPGEVDGNEITENSIPCRVPCSQPFHVGDRVRVVKDGHEWCGVSGQVSDTEPRHDGKLFIDFGTTGADYIEPHVIEPAEPSTDYTPPDGWRVKGDDEVVAKGDAFSHHGSGKLHDPPVEFQFICVGMSVRDARISQMPSGGYILTPIVPPATPQPDVSQGQQTDDGWEIYKPVKGEVYSPGTEFKSKPRHSLVKNWTPQLGERAEFPSNETLIYRRPIQKQQPAKTPAEDTAQLKAAGLYRECRAVEHKPLDIDLLSVERKINLASKDRPDLLDWWRDEKEKLAIEAGKRIGGGM